MCRDRRRKGHDRSQSQGPSNCDAYNNARHSNSRPRQSRKLVFFLRRDNQSVKNTLLQIDQCFFCLEEPENLQCKSHPNMHQPLFSFKSYKNSRRWLFEVILIIASVKKLNKDRSQRNDLLLNKFTFFLFIIYLYLIIFICYHFC